MGEINKPDDNIAKPEKSSGPTKPVNEGFQTRQDLSVIQKLENGISLPKQFQTLAFDSAKSAPDSDQKESSQNGSPQRTSARNAGQDAINPPLHTSNDQSVVSAAEVPLFGFNKENSEPAVPDRGEILSVEQEKEKLFNTIDAITSPEQRKIFQDYIAAFEARAKKDQLPEHEVAQTFRALNDLLGLGTPESVRLGSYALAHISYPTTINIGLHDACPLAFNESRIATLHPSVYLSVLTGVAGPNHQFRTAEGNTVKIDPGSLQEENWPQQADRSLRRTIASQYFQVAAANVYWQGRNARLGDGNWQYQTNHKREFEGDTGDRLVDRGFNPPQVVTGQGKPIYTSQINNYGQVDIYRQLVGKVPDVLSITNFEDAGPDLVAPTTNVRSEQQLRQVLDGIAHGTGENKFPVALTVHTSNEPWLTDSGRNGQGAGSHGYHTVAITGFNPETGEVFVDNWWSGRRDHLGKPGTLPAMTVPALYASMSPKE